MQLGLACNAHEPGVAPTIIWIELRERKRCLWDTVLAAEQGTELTLRDLLFEVFFGFAAYSTCICLHLGRLDLFTLSEAIRIAVRHWEDNFFRIKGISQVICSDRDHGLSGIKHVVFIHCLLGLGRLVELFLECILVLDQLQDTCV